MDTYTVRWIQQQKLIQRVTADGVYMYTTISLENIDDKTHIHTRTQKKSPVSRSLGRSINEGAYVVQVFAIRASANTLKYKSK